VVSVTTNITLLERMRCGKLWVFCSVINTTRSLDLIHFVFLILFRTIVTLRRGIQYFVVQLLNRSPSGNFPLFCDAPDTQSSNSILKEVAKFQARSKERAMEFRALYSFFLSQTETVGGCYTFSFVPVHFCF
jgi:hypothetical protein